MKQLEIDTAKATKLSQERTAMHSEDVYGTYERRFWTGEVQLKLEFFPAGRLKINCHAGRNLIDTDTFGRQDPYVVFRMNTPLVKLERKTKTDTDGGTEPVWEEINHMPIVHQYEMIIDVMAEEFPEFLMVLRTKLLWV